MQTGDLLDNEWLFRKNVQIVPNIHLSLAMNLQICDSEIDDCIPQEDRSSSWKHEQ